MQQARSTFSVHEIGQDDRLYEVVTRSGEEGPTLAHQISGPPLELRVSEVQFNFGRTGRRPDHPRRQHIIHGMNRVATIAGVSLHKQLGEKGSTKYFVNQTRLESS